MKTDRKSNAMQAFLGERGSASVWALSLMVSSMVVGGLAIDGSNAWRVRQKLQIAADAASLAAAQKLPDVDAARTMALDVAQRNLGGDALDQAAIMAQDVKFGTWSDAKGFTEGATDDGTVTAVQIDAARSLRRGNALGTFLLGLVGVDSFEPSVSSTAIPMTTSTVGNKLSCEDAMILTSGQMNTGGGNVLNGDICLHGTRGLLTGGGDYYAGGVQLSAATRAQVTVNYTVPGSETADEVARASDLTPVVLPKLSSMFETLWSGIYSGLSKPNGKDLVVDGYYTGNLLPDFLKDSNGRIAVVYVDNNGWWTVQPGQLQPHTIYLVNHGMQIAGGVQAQNVAIIARGDIGVGGGANLHYTNDYFFSTGTINTGGDIYWGDAGSYCTSGAYSVYTFAYNTVSLGGWGGGAGAHGLFGAAKTFSPGGAMKNSGGLYFEASNDTQLGGNLSFNACGKRLESFYDSAVPRQTTTVTKTGKLKL